MARIILGGYMVRYPLGGSLSSNLQWLVGLRRLGHEVWFVEKAGWTNSCYDPVRDVMSDDCSYGTATLQSLLQRFDLNERWAFVDASGRYHGLSRSRVAKVFASADLFIDRGAHGSWLDEAAGCSVRALVDGEPGANQMKMQASLAAGSPLPEYDLYYTVGLNVGSSASTAPTAGKDWRPLHQPVVTDLYPAYDAPRSGAPFTTVMKWRSHAPIVHDGQRFGQKDVELERFLELPRLTSATLELAVAGRDAPKNRLRDAGWRIRDAHAVTASYDSYGGYIAESSGEFAVAKHVFVSTNSGWFSDRSAAYLSSARPVVLQDTGFSAHLPCGNGLFAVLTIDEAVDALERIRADADRHRQGARAIALEHLDARRVLSRVLADAGVR
jgi:hypothetical protein